MYGKGPTRENGNGLCFFKWWYSLQGPGLWLRQTATRLGHHSAPGKPSNYQTKKIKEVKNGNFQPFYLYYFDVCSGCAGTRRVTWWCWLTPTSSPWPPWRARASPQSSSSNTTMEWLSSGSVFSSSTLTVSLNLFGNTMREKVMKNNRRSIFKTVFVFVDF